MGFYLASVTLNQAALAQGQVRRAAACWVGCALAFIGWTLLPVMDEFRRVEVGFAGAAALLCALLYVLYRRPRARPEDVVQPDSPQEIEARLAAADEAAELATKSRILRKRSACRLVRCLPDPAGQQYLPRLRR